MKQSGTGGDVGAARGRARRGAARARGLEEIAAGAEFYEKREATMAAVRAEMGRGASVQGGGAGGGWDHSGMATAALDAATAECASFPRLAPEASKLLEDARLISQLRTALKDRPSAARRRGGRSRPSSGSRRPTTTSTSSRRRGSRCARRATPRRPR